MNTIIAGSRHIHNMAHVIAGIVHCPWYKSITRVICGESMKEINKYLAGLRKGNPDIFGAVWALNNNIPIDYYPADWDAFDIQHGNPAGPIRNAKMASVGDSLILVWNKTSRGSLDMLTKARLAGYAKEFIFEWEVNDGQEVVATRRGLFD